MQKTNTKLSTVAEELGELDLMLESGYNLDMVQKGYGQKLIDGISRGDKILELESIKSLGDLYLQKGRIHKNKAAFTKAADLYCVALDRCEDLNGWETLKHRIKYAEKVRGKGKNGSSLPAIAGQSARGHAHIVQQLLKALVKELLKTGVEVDRAMLDGAYPLHIAAQEEHVGVVQQLLKAGADIHMAMQDEATLLHIAAQEGRMAVEELLMAGALVDRAMQDRATPLYIAAQEGHVGFVELLLKAVLAVYKAKQDGATPLHIAAQEGHVDVVELLLFYGAEVNMAMQDGSTPLYIAAQEGHVDVVELLLKAGAKQVLGRPPQMAGESVPFLFGAGLEEQEDELYHGQPESWIDGNGALATLTVEHLQCFEVRRTFDLHPKTTAITGPNSSGKTTVLQGMLLFATLFYEMSSTKSSPETGQGSQFISTSVITKIFALTDIRDFWHQRNTEKPVTIIGGDVDGNEVKFMINFIMGGSLVKVDKMSTGMLSRLAGQAQRPMLAVLDTVKSDDYKPQVPVEVPLPLRVERLDNTKVFSMLCELRRNTAYWKLFHNMLQAVHPGCAVRLISGRQRGQKVLMVREGSVDIPLQTCQSSLLQTVAVLVFVLHSVKHFFSHKPVIPDSGGQPNPTVLLDDIGSLLGSETFSSLSKCLSNMKLSDYQTVHCQTVITTLWLEVAQECEQITCINEEPDIALVLNNLDDIGIHLGDHSKATKYWKPSLQMLLPMYGDGKGHPDIAISLKTSDVAFAWSTYVARYKQEVRMAETPTPLKDMPGMPMTEEHRSRLQSHYATLIRDLETKHLFPILVEKGVLTQAMVEDIEKTGKGTRQDINKGLIEFLQRREDRAFHVFCQALRSQDCKQGHLANLLEGPNGVTSTNGTEGSPSAFPIEKYREAVSYYYKHQLCQQQPLVSDEEFILDVADTFTTIDILPYNSRRQAYDRQPLESVAHIFNPAFNPNLASPARILLWGAAGIGKTTAIAKLLTEWDKQEVEVLQQYDLVFAIALRKVRRSQSLVDSIFDQLLSEDEVLKKEELTNYLQTSNRVLIILDGYDELEWEPEENHDIMKLLTGRLFPRVSVMVTTRPMCSSEVIAKMKPDTRVEILGFSPDNIKSYVLKYFGEQASKKGATLLQKIGLTLLNTGILSVPILLLHVCVLWEDDEDVLVMISDKVCLLYNLVVTCLVRRYGKKDRNPVSLEDIQTLLHGLEKLAFEYLLQGRVLFNKEDVVRYCGNAFRILVQSGLLKEQKSPSRTNPVVQFSFSHKTMQEYFAAQWLSEKFTIDEANRQEILQLYFPTARMVQTLGELLIFTCGKLRQKAKFVLHYLLEIHNTSDVQLVEEEFYNFFVTGRSKRQWDKDIKLEDFAREDDLKHQFAGQWNDYPHVLLTYQNYIQLFLLCCHESDLTAQFAKQVFLRNTIQFSGANPRVYSVLSRMIAAEESEKTRQIEHLRLVNTQNYVLGPVLERLGQLSGLTELNLRQSRLGWHTPNCTIPRRLQLRFKYRGIMKTSEVDLAKAPALLARQLPLLKLLKKLVISWNDLGPEDMKPLLLAMKKLGHLEELFLSGNDLGGLGKDVADLIAVLPKLKVFKVYFCQLSLDELLMIASRLTAHCPALELFDFQLNPIQPDEFKWIGEAEMETVKAALRDTVFVPWGAKLLTHPY